MGFNSSNETPSVEAPRICKLLIDSHTLIFVDKINFRKEKVHEVTKNFVDFQNFSTVISKKIYFFNSPYFRNLMYKPCRDNPNISAAATIVSGELKSCFNTNSFNYIASI